MNNTKKTNLIILAIIIIGISTRFLSNIFTNYPANFTAIGAIALFSAAYFSNKRLALLFPIGLMLLSDFLLVIINHNWLYLTYNANLYVYGSFVLMILIGFYLRKNRKPLAIFGSALVGSIAFFIITNFGAWVSGMALHPSLVAVYIDGIPFFRSTLVSNIVFSGVFFTAAYYIFDRQKVTVAVANDK